jgi:hypothetical protein
VRFLIGMRSPASHPVGRDRRTTRPFTIAAAKAEFGAATAYSIEQNPRLLPKEHRTLS